MSQRTKGKTISTLAATGVTTLSLAVAGAIGYHAYAESSAVETVASTSTPSAAASTSATTQQGNSQVASGTTSSDSSSTSTGSSSSGTTTQSGTSSSTTTQQYAQAPSRSNAGSSTGHSSGS